MSTRVPLTLACGNYDRTRALHEGTVVPEGIELTTLELEPEEIFFRMSKFQEFDVSELSISSYVLTMRQPGGSPFVALPIFPSRSFRHSGIYVNTAAGIGVPADLRGRTVGVAEYQLSANVWIRGFLQDRYGVEASSVSYRTGGLHDAGRVEKIAVDLPPDVDIAPIAAGRTLSDMLVSGEIDAIYSPRTPAPFLDGHPAVGRLFPDFKAAEVEYFQATGIFPIMHVIAVRREIYERNRWIARSLVKAFEQARQIAFAGLERTTALRYSLPWLVADLAQTRAVMGEDFWTYGLDERNRATIAAFLRYSYSQGLAERAYEPDELFAPESLDAVLI